MCVGFALRATTTKAIGEKTEMRRLRMDEIKIMTKRLPKLMESVPTVSTLKKGTNSPAVVAAARAERKQGRMKAGRLAMNQRGFLK